MLAMNRYWAEFFGTFMLVFAGAGAITINDLYGGAITHAGIALVFGLVVLAVIYAIGNISGAHINPAVSVALTVAGKFESKQLLPYLFSQFMGGIVASAMLWFLFLEITPAYEALPNVAAPTTNYGATIPAGSSWQSFGFEFILTWFLMLVIMGVTTGSQIKGELAGIAIGATVALEAMFAGPVCGASMNPARSLGPALFSGQWPTLWVYFLGPIVGAIVAVGTFKLIQGTDASEAA